MKRGDFIAGAIAAWPLSVRAQPVDLMAGTRLTRTDHLVALTSLLLIVALLWAPFGHRVGLTYEEWKALYWTVEVGGVPVLFPNRPLHYLPNTLAHLTGRPLEALNLMQAGSIFGKGALVYLLVVRMMPGAGALALLVGAGLLPPRTGEASGSPRSRSAANRYSAAKNGGQTNASWESELRYQGVFPIMPRWQKI